MRGTDPGRPPSRRSTAVPPLMLVAVLTGETCELPYRSPIDPPPSSDRRSSSRSPGDTFLKRVSSDSAVPPFTPRPPSHPGSRLNHNHRTPWSRRHRCKLANVPAFLNESFIFHMPASRSRRVAPRTPPSPPGPANPLLPHPLRESGTNRGRLRGLVLPVGGVVEVGVPAPVVLEAQAVSAALIFGRDEAEVDQP